MSIFPTMTHSEAANEAVRDKAVSSDKPEGEAKKPVDQPINDPASKPENFIPFEEL